MKIKSLLFVAFVVSSTILWHAVAEHNALRSRIGKAKVERPSTRKILEMVKPPRRSLEVSDWLSVYYLSHNSNLTSNFVIPQHQGTEEAVPCSKSGKGGKGGKGERRKLCDVADSGTIAASDRGSGTPAVDLDLDLAEDLSLRRPMLLHRLLLMSQSMVFRVQSAELRTAKILSATTAKMV